MWMKTIQQHLKSSNLSLNEAIVLWLRIVQSGDCIWCYAFLVVHARNDDDITAVSVIC